MNVLTWVIVQAALVYIPPFYHFKAKTDEDQSTQQDEKNHQGK